MYGHFRYRATSVHCCFGISKPLWYCLTAQYTHAPIHHSCGRAAVLHFLIWGTEQRPGVELRRRYVCHLLIRRSSSPTPHCATPPIPKEISKTRPYGDDRHTRQTPNTLRTSDCSWLALRPPAHRKKRAALGKPCSSWNRLLACGSSATVMPIG